MRFTDSHCHLTMPEEEDRRSGQAESGSAESGQAGLPVLHLHLGRARAGGVVGFVVPATKLEDAAPAVAFAQQHDDVWAAVGFHPHEAKDCDDAAFAEIERLAKQERVVAIGEAGLDYHYMHSPRDVQRAVFMRHVDLARRLDVPVIVHNRQSTEDLLELLTSGEARGARGILHSYTEGLEPAKKLIDLGYYISFSGILTFKSADMLRAVAKALPHDRVLIETDTPFLAPVPFRGRQNEPAFVVKVAELLAGLWSVPLEEVAARTTANFEAAFSVRLPR